ncbi:MAG: ABC transporter ATP-binding protein [Burkholderiales bacterium]|nr:ABC transporter ATP-binding protein [Burkholderiales bacterium]
MTAIITLDKVSKSYRDKRFRRFQALNEVSLTVCPGEAFGFVGPNGAGKSTTMKILTGIIKADSGEAHILGIPVSDHRARMGMSYVPENPYLYDYLTPLEMLLMGCRMHGLPESGQKERCKKVLERFGIAHVADKRIRTFSKGMTQRAALAHALACQPKLLMLDEPLSGLDPLGRKDVVDILLDYRDQGGTIFFSSHVLNDVQRLGDRFGIIHKGELRSVSTPAELAGWTDSSLLVRTQGTTPVPGMAREGVDKWQLDIKEDELIDLLPRLKEAGHKIIDVRRGPSLEQAFLRFVREAEGGDLPRQVDN